MSDSQLTVFTSSQSPPSLTNLTRFALNDDASPGSGSSRLEFEAEQGSTYFIAVDNNIYRAPGHIRLTLFQIVPPTLQLFFNPDGPALTGRLIGTPERAYWIQSSTNFSQWQVVLTNQFGASNTFEFFEKPTGPRKFLRALEADWFLRRTWATIEKNCGDLFRIAA